MYLSREAITAAKTLTLPDEDNRELTTYDEGVWKQALKWYTEKVIVEREVLINTDIKKISPKVLAKVYVALKQAKEI